MSTQWHSQPQSRLIGRTGQEAMERNQARFVLSGLVIQLKSGKVCLVLQLGHPRKDKTAQDTNK